MERLTTDNPRNNTEVALNLVYAKDGQAWVRNGGPAPGYPDVELYDYMRLIVADHGPMSIKADLTDDELGDALYDALFDGIETKEGLCAMLYTLAWAFAELRQRLAAYEDTGLTPADVAKFWAAFCEARAMAQALGQEYADRADKLLEADAEGRLLVLPCKVGDVVYQRDSYGNLYEATVQSIVIDNRRMIFITSGIGFDCDAIGKSVFLSREEAEKALGGMEEWL